VEFFHYMKTETPGDAVVVFSKPRALSLLAGRRAAASREPADDRELWAFFRHLDASYLVVGPPAAEDTRREELLGFVARNGPNLELQFSNADFHVYRIRQPGS
jgi:hypothetical protein